MSKIKALAIAAGLALSSVFISCNDSNDDSVDMFMSFVTYTESTETGSIFTTRQNLDSPLITYTSSIVLKADQYPVGKRYIIGFTNEENKRFVSGPINLAAVMNVINGKIETATPEAIAKLSAGSYHLSLLQREGTYINIEAAAPMQYAPKTFGLYMDENTADNEIPEVYVGYEPDNTGGYERQFYASIDISSVWNKPTCKGIRFHFKNNGMDSEYTFEKNAPSTPEPLND